MVIVYCKGLHAQPFATLNANNVSAGIAANGVLFQGGLEIPKNSGKKSLGLAQVWIGGKGGGGLHMAGQMYKTSADFWPGIIDTSGNATDTNAWKNIYKVTAQEIAAHKTGYDQPGYVMPDGIKHWPGSHPAQPSKVLAPFVDHNNNFIYEPQAGEYPFIRGDEAVYFIINDKADTHTETGALPMGVEVHGMAYVYANQPGLGNTVFLTLWFLNRSANNYDSVYTGLWTDFALGTPGDEYVSTFPAKSAYMVYDDNKQDTSYGANPPAQGIVFLSPQLQYTIEVAADNSARGMPQAPGEFYGYLKRTWRDGEPLTQGIDGYKQSTPTDFIYNGNPCDINNPGWTEVGSSLQPGRRTMVGSVGPFTLASKGFLKMDVAFVWARDNSNPISGVCALNNTIDSVRKFYREVITNVPAVVAGNFNIYPNPANDIVTVETDEQLSENITAEIFDIQGRKVAGKIITAGSNIIDTRTLAAGIYTIRVQAGLNSSVQKLVISR